MEQLRIISSIIVIFTFIMTVLIDSVNHNYTNAQEEADVIVILGGEDEGRMSKAAELYKAGYAESVLITPVIDHAEFYQSLEDAVRLGIPESQLILEYDATSTYTNATRTMELMRAHGFTSALIVTSDYHINRSKLIFDRVNDGEFRFKYVPALSSEGEEWHDRDYAFQIWWSEFVKMWGYRFGMYKIVDLDVEFYQP